MTHPRPDGATGLGAEIFGTFSNDDGAGRRDIAIFLDGKRAPPAFKAVTGVDGYVVGPAVIPGTNNLLDPDDHTPVITVGHVQVYEVIT